METQRTYCFEYLVTRAKMPRHRTCCPFMQRTLYRVSRNLARLDLGFSCPDFPEGRNCDAEAVSPGHQQPPTSSSAAAVGDNNFSAQSATNTAENDRIPGPRRKQRLSLRIIKWFMHSARDNSDTLSSVPPLDSNESDTMAPVNSRAPQEAFLADDDPSGLRQKRKKVRRQKMSYFDVTPDSTTALLTNGPRGAQCSLPDQSVYSNEMERTTKAVHTLTCQPPTRTFHVRRIHARRTSSASQAGMDSMDLASNGLPTIPNNAQMSVCPERHPLVPEKHQPVVSQKFAMQQDVIPPYSVRYPVEKQVQNWLESTTDEYEILLKRRSGRQSIAANKIGGENRSLELRHQISNESAKRQPTSGSDAGSRKKQLPRLLKQTTPVSQAIIQNHLEHQHQPFGRSPLIKELAVPSFGFDSGEMSMLQSLEENPEEDFKSLLLPATTQRRFSDNPLTEKQPACCAYKPMLSPALQIYSTRHLDACGGKLQSAPARSFCCTLHKKNEYDRSYRSPNCTGTGSQQRIHPTPTSYSEMLMMTNTGEGGWHSQQTSEECCSCSRLKTNSFQVEDMANDAVSECHSPAHHSLGCPSFAASPRIDLHGQRHQERLSWQICRDRLRGDMDHRTQCLDIFSNKDLFEQELKRRLDRDTDRLDVCDDRAASQSTANASRLIPPDLVFSPASRRVSAIDIEEDVDGSSIIKMLTVGSPSRQLSRQNSIYSMEEVLHHPKTSFSPQSSFSSEKGTFLTPEYQTNTLLASNEESKRWVKPARSFDQFAPRNFTVHRAASHSPSHLSALGQDSIKPTTHRSDSDCFVRTPLQISDQFSPTSGQSAPRGVGLTPEFLSLDSSNSDPQHLEIEFMREHRHSYNPDGPAIPPTQFRNVNQHFRSDSIGETKPQPPLLRSKPTSLTTSADCLQQRPGVLQNVGHRCVYTNYANSQTYREATRRLAQKKKQQRSGKDMHPRKSLEVEGVWSSSQSMSLHSSNSPSRRGSNVNPLRQKSSESEGTASGVRMSASPSQRSRRCIRRDYTIDEKTDEIFQTFLQQDP